MKITLTTTFLTLILIALMGCKKNKDSQNSYFVIMNIDNKSFLFSDSLYATKQASNPVLTISVYDKESGTAQFQFSDYDYGTYNDTNDTMVKKTIIQFTVNASTTFPNSNTIFVQRLVLPKPDVDNPITLTISNVNSSYVEGSFSGKLITGSNLKTISNGHFRIPFK